MLLFVKAVLNGELLVNLLGMCYRRTDYGLNFLLLKGVNCLAFGMKPPFDAMGAGLNMCSVFSMFPISLFCFFPASRNLCLKV